MITLTKIEGAGNSFWITHQLPSPPHKNSSFISFTEVSAKKLHLTKGMFLKGEWSEISKKLCQKNKNLITDGLVVLLNSDKQDLKWLFYNADGSIAEMCGNATCCVAEYAFKKELISNNKSHFILETKAQNIKCIYKNKASIELKQSTNIKGAFKSLLSDEEITYMFIDSSVPHAVIEIPKWPNDSKTWEKQKTLAKALRKNTSLNPHGMNVSFYSYQHKEQTKLQNLNSPISLKACSFERGVEDFTPACGTGALAVAQIYRLKHPDTNSIAVKMPGGTLQVNFLADKKISLFSPVKWIQEINLLF